MTNNKINILYHQKLQKLDPVGQFCSYPLVYHVAAVYSRHDLKWSSATNMAELLWKSVVYFNQILQNLNHWPANKV